MEDEHADRVYVPGTNATPPPPARDVEPFWPPEELEAPVHGGRPVPHEPPPSLPLRGTQPPPVPPLTDQPFLDPAIPSRAPVTGQQPVATADPGVYRPANRGSAPPPARPVPSSPARPVPAEEPDPGTTQAWPNIAPRGARVEPSTGPSDLESAGMPGVSRAPADPPGPNGSPAPTLADSPWSQPPQRPAPAPGPVDDYDDVDIQPLGRPDRIRPRSSPGFEPHTDTRAPNNPVAQRAAYYPTVTPRRAAGQRHDPESSVPARPAEPDELGRSGMRPAGRGAAQVTPPTGGPNGRQGDPAVTGAGQPGPAPLPEESESAPLTDRPGPAPRTAQTPGPLIEHAGPTPHTHPGSTGTAPRSEQAGLTGPAGAPQGPGQPRPAFEQAAPGQRPDAPQPGAGRGPAPADPAYPSLMQGGPITPSPTSPAHPVDQRGSDQPGWDRQQPAPQQWPHQDRTREQQWAADQQRAADRWTAEQRMQAQHAQNGQAPAGSGQSPVQGPYPPAVDPRTVPPHPTVHQAPQGNAEPPPGDPYEQVPPGDPYQQVPWVSDGSAPTAEEFARRRLARPTEPVATMGPRALLQKGTLGLLKLPPGRREQEYKQDVEMVRRNFGGLRQVTVVNPKGGAGKTVAVLLLAMTFGQKRGGYVLAWDNNETQGTLGMRAQQDFHARTVRDMMRDLHMFRGSQGRVGDLSQYVRAQGEGMFDVLASDESATAGEMLTASAFGEIREIVSRFYKLIFVDTGNNVRAHNWQAAMDATDQLVITMSARNDSAETAARMLDHLEQSGRQRLVRQAISVVSMPPTRKDIDLPAIERHFAARTRAVLISPYEKLIDSGEPLRYGHLSSNTRDAWLKIAAAVAEGL